MTLTAAIQAFLMEAELPAGESIEDIVLDAQEYGMEQIIDQIVPLLSPEDAEELDDMIDEEVSIWAMDARFATKVPNYDQYVVKAMEHVREYLIVEEE